MVVILVVVALFLFISKPAIKNPPQNNNSTTTTPKNNKPTPTGSGISTSKNDNTVTAKLGQTISIGSSIKGTLTELVADNRCPIDVQCIQAGTVKIKISFVYGLQKQETTFTLGELLTIYEHSITLVGVKPEKVSSLPIASADYVFTFLIK